MARTAFKNTASWPFQISQVKRLFIKRQKTTGNVIVRGEGSYRMDIGVYKSLIQLKKKKELPGILFNADIVKKTNILPIAKFNDVHKLLEAHFGPEWKSNSELEFYTKLSLGNPEEQSDEPEPYCEQVLEDVTETV